ncbi:MAG: hypothetical protein ABIH86_07145 [Planctomycetota bacterium]
MTLLSPLRHRIIQRARWAARLIAVAGLLLFPAAALAETPATGEVGRPRASVERMEDLKSKMIECSERIKADPKDRAAREELAGLRRAMGGELADVASRYADAAARAATTDERTNALVRAQKYIDAAAAYDPGSEPVLATRDRIAQLQKDLTPEPKTDPVTEPIEPEVDPKAIQKAIVAAAERLKVAAQRLKEAPNDATARGVVAESRTEYANGLMDLAEYWERSTDTASDNATRGQRLDNADKLLAKAKQIVPSSERVPRIADAIATKRRALDASANATVPVVALAETTVVQPDVRSYPPLAEPDVNRDDVANTVVQLIDELKRVSAQMKLNPSDPEARKEYAALREKLYDAFLIVSKCWEASADRTTPPAPRNDCLDVALKYAQKAITLVPDGSEAKESIERILWRLDHAPVVAIADSTGSANLSGSEVDDSGEAAVSQTDDLAIADADSLSDATGRSGWIPRWGVGFGIMVPQESDIIDYQSSAALSLAFRLGQRQQPYWAEGVLTLPLMKNQSDNPDITSNLYFATVSAFYAPLKERVVYGVLGLSLGYEEVRDQSETIETNVAPLVILGIGTSWRRDSIDGRLTYSIPFGSRNADGFLGLGVTYYFL